MVLQSGDGRGSFAANLEKYVRASVVLTSLCLAAAPAFAQEPPEKFYAGRQMRLIVPYPPPSSFDTYARLVARHMPRHIPGGPSIVIQTVPGAGGLNAVQTFANEIGRAHV